VPELITIWMDWLDRALKSEDLTCQYHMRKRVGQTVSDIRTHPLTQVVLTAPPAESENR
jgi:hypothetical protein